MAESQSRYSIVERLTRSKLDLMSAKNELETNELRLKQEFQDYTDGMEKIKLQFNEKTKFKVIEIEEEKQKEITELHNDNHLNMQMITDKYTELKNELSLLLATKKDKVTLYNNKIKAIEESLNHIKLIGDTTIEKK